MQLTLDRHDLKPEYRNINCSQTRLEHFKEKVQKVVKSVGFAYFYEWDGSNHNRIFER